MTDPGLHLALPPSLLDAIAVHVADELERRGHLAGTTPTATPWLTIDEAANYLRCAKQRLYDLASSGELARSRTVAGRCIAASNSTRSWSRHDPS